MASAYLIRNTGGTLNITIQPGTLNGPTGVASDSDVNMYGVGALNWGGKVDENFLRLAENFACPESLTAPGSAQPQDSAELGVTGAGVNNPIQGQTWFNTTDGHMYINTDSMAAGFKAIIDADGGTLGSSTVASQDETDFDGAGDNGTFNPGNGPGQLKLTHTEVDFDGVPPNGSFVGGVGPGFLKLTHTETDFDSSPGNGSFVGGDGVGGTSYAPGDAITMSNGATILVGSVLGNGDVNTFTVTSIGSSVAPGDILTQVSTVPPISGVGFVMTVGFANVDAHQIGDTITLSNGATIAVDNVDTNYDVTEFTVATVGGVAAPATPLTQIGTTGYGAGFVLTPGFATVDAYQVGDTITMENGMEILVDAVDGNDDVSQFTITNVGYRVERSVTLTQDTTTGVGLGFTLTPETNNLVTSELFGLPATPSDKTAATSKEYVDGLTSFISGAYVPRDGSLDMFGTLRVTSGANIQMEDGGRVLIEDGTSANPSLAFRTDGLQDTGLYTQGDGNLSVATNGILALSVDAGSTLISTPFSFQSGAATFLGNINVGTGNASYITMADADEGARQIHCNSNRIGFLNQAAGWGSWCNDDGSWENSTSMTSPQFNGNLNGNLVAAAPTAPTPPAGDSSTRVATTAFVSSDGVGRVVTSGFSGSTVVPAGVTAAEIYIVGGGGGGASGGDGGSWNGDDGDDGGNTVVSAPTFAARTALGGLGGRGDSPLLSVTHSVGHVFARRVRGAGYGIENPGNLPGPPAGNGPPTRGGDGGSTTHGFGGAGSSSFGTPGGLGAIGGGGGGGVGQDDRAGEGGGSGKEHTFVAPVTPGQTVSWTIGAGGAGGDPADVPGPDPTDRYGGDGGDGFIIIKWFKL